MTSASSKDKKSYVNVTPVPTQSAPKEIRYDFNLGARVMLPKREKGLWKVTLQDLDTGNILFQGQVAGGTVSSSKRFYVNFKITVEEIENNVTRQVFNHQLDLIDKKVVIQCPVGTIGDTFAWLPYAIEFKKKHSCKLHCIIDEKFIDLLKRSYPEINFTTMKKAEENNIFSDSYACYYFGLFFKDEQNLYQPCDFRLVGLHKTAAYILGLSTEKDEKLTLRLPDESRPIKEKYVCIAVQASSQCKYWNNPKGWELVVDYLKSQNYRVICIDQNTISGHGIIFNSIPYNAENETGNRPLSERARWLKHAEFFVGLSSGLSWMAWTMNIPVVMISGFTHPMNEFYTPYRIINWHVCNSCWNDMKYEFEHDNYTWCPRHRDTPRHYECTKSITSTFVIQVIQKLISNINKE